MGAAVVVAGPCAREVVVGAAVGAVASAAVTVAVAPTLARADEMLVAFPTAVAWGRVDTHTRLTRHCPAEHNTSRLALARTGYVRPYLDTGACSEYRSD